MRNLLPVLLLTFLAAARAQPNSSAAGGEDPKPLPDIATFTADLDKRPGFMPLYWDERSGKAYLELQGRERQAIYVHALAGGVGSNDILLDRGQLGGTRLVQFRRAGPEVLLIQPNLGFRAGSDNADERRAVDEAFAQSVLAAFPLAARSGERVLFAVNSLVLEDVHGVTARLNETKQGDYSLDTELSAIVPEALKNFPRNTVVEAWLTFRGEKPGEHVRQVTPTPRKLTVRARHAFVAPPERGYRPRRYHPRAGYFPFTYKDYGVGLDSDITRRYIVRHRIERTANGAVEPIVYYVDRGAPEPVRSALMEGASWWQEAFAAAGYENAFRVELLPEGADPLDVRYNVIQWVHRATRGWSYGYGVIDPRTGEMLKGHVTLGSQRVRQDQRIFEALLNEGGSPQARATALARLRQLAAHEVGHTLGLAHNFAASADGDASVMDYPHPNVRVENGEITLEDAYDTGIGAWDKYAIRYGYQSFDDPAEALPALVRQAREAGLRYLSDQHSRTPQAAHPFANLWDNGSDPLARWQELIAVRATALSNLDRSALRPDQAISALERKLVPVYLLHRYQLRAVAKLIGGQTFAFGLAGEDVPVPQPVPAERQHQALMALLEALRPEQLALRDGLLDDLHPAPPGYARDREYFEHATGNTFDPLAPARALAQLVAGELLERHRLARLLVQHGADRELPGLERVLDQVIAATIRRDRRQGGYAGVLEDTVDWTVLHELMRVARTPAGGEADTGGADIVRHAVRLRLGELRDWLLARSRRRGGSDFHAEAARTLQLFLAEPDVIKLPPRHPIPPGSPI